KIRLAISRSPRRSSEIRFSVRRARHSRSAIIQPLRRKWGAGQEKDADRQTPSIATHVFFPLHQNTYFRANCRTRYGALVGDGGVASVVIMPNVFGAPKLTPGLPGRRLFVTLNASNRKTRVWPSRIRKSLETACSHCQNPGPRTAPTPRFPNVPRGGAAKGDGLNQLLQNA